MRNWRGPGLAQDPGHSHWPAPPVALTCTHNALPDIVWQRDRERERGRSRKRVERQKTWQSNSVMSQQPDGSVVYAKSVQMMKKTDPRRCSATTLSLTRPQRCQEAESVFLIFCKTFGTSKIGYTACMFAAAVGRSREGWGFPPFTQTRLMTENGT